MLRFEFEGMADMCDMLLSKCPMVVLKLPYNYNMDVLDCKFSVDQMFTTKKRAMLFVAIIASKEE
jgi:hypothetical protein